MKYVNVFIAALFTLLFCASGFAQESIYTWKDRNGVLNITDYRPPSGAEIIDVSPSYRQEAEELQHRRQLRLRELKQRESQRETMRLREQRDARKAKREEAYRSQEKQYFMFDYDKKGKEKAGDKKRKGY